MARYTQELLDETIRVWQSHSDVELTTQDAIEILDNFIELNELLDELEDKYGKEKMYLPHKQN